jgi:hypothetical protein
VSARPTLSLLTCISIATGLAACGGGGTSTTSTASTSAQSDSVTSASPTPGTSTGSAAKAPDSEGAAGSGTGSAAEGGSAGPGGEGEGAQPSNPSSSSGGPGGSPHPAGAAGFILPEGDNSIPEYGEEADASARQAATDALRSYLGGREDEEWSRACTYMAEPVRGQLEVLAGGGGGKPLGCNSSFAKLAKFGSPGEREDPLTGGLASFRVEGEKGFALFYGPGEQRYMMPMVSEGGAWKVNQIGPVAYPIGR